jgi:hypothetical protein
MGQVLISTCNLFWHFGRMLRGRSRSYCYSRQFDCGAVATVVFKHFRNATLRTVLWESPCRRKGSLKRWCCEWEFRAWLLATEDQEAKANHFRFPHEGSLICDLRAMNTIIFSPRSLIRTIDVNEHPQLGNRFHE